MNPTQKKSGPKAAWIVGAVLVTVAVSGYFMGLRQTGSQISMNQPVSLVAPDPDRRALSGSDIPPAAVAYAQQDWLRDGANAQWRSHVADLLQPPVDPAMATNVTEAQRAMAVAARAARRAFDGAPPVVPHPIAQDSSAACLACHGPGLAVKDKVASRISHAAYSSCSQCHVAAGGLGLGGAGPALLAPLAGNHFAGAEAPLKGSRAGPHAPPTIPHGTRMRGDCLSCHGPRALFGLRTPHPERQSCAQCHAADAALDHHVLSSFAGQTAPVSPGGKTE